jgi:hypothetical protein
VKFWQEKYEEAMKIVRKLKRHYPQDMETLSEKEIEEFTPASPPCMFTRKERSMPRLISDIKDEAMVGAKNLGPIVCTPKS